MCIYHMQKPDALGGALFKLEIIPRCNFWIQNDWTKTPFKENVHFTKMSKKTSCFHSCPCYRLASCRLVFSSSSVAAISPENWFIWLIWLSESESKHPPLPLQPSGGCLKDLPAEQRAPPRIFEGLAWAKSSLIPSSRNFTKSGRPPPPLLGSSFSSWQTASLHANKMITIKMRRGKTKI